MKYEPLKSIVIPPAFVEDENGNVRFGVNGKRHRVNGPPIFVGGTLYVFKR